MGTTNEGTIEEREIQQIINLTEEHLAGKEPVEDGYKYSFGYVKEAIRQALKFKDEILKRAQEENELWGQLLESVGHECTEYCPHCKSKTKD